MIYVASLIFINLTSCLSLTNHPSSSTAEDNNTRGLERNTENMTDKAKQNLYGNFLDILNCFNYPNSEIKVLANENENLFYIVLETVDTFEKVEQFYIQKKVQSTWNKSEKYKSSTTNVESNFLDLEDNNANDVKVTKFTYYSQEMDSIVNILIKDLGGVCSEICIIYWELKQ